MTDQPSRQAPPASEAMPSDPPHALTFFLSAAQRRAVLRALRRLDANRASALLRALGLEKQEARR